MATTGATNDGVSRSASGAISASVILVPAPGATGVHGDAPAATFDGEHSGQTDQTGLGGTVVGLAEAAEDAGARRRARRRGRSSAGACAARPADVT